MNWKDYEIEIYNHFKEMYVNSDISHNTTILGRYSKTKRQIDFLIEDYVADNRIRIIIDSKYFLKRIDVKEVESFISMLNDCEANKGLLITSEGYSKAAINRAYHAPLDIELDILNFKNLHDYQGILAIPYSRNHGVTLPAPFGWIINIDNPKENPWLVTIRQRGLTVNEAKKNNEWIYVNIFDKDNSIKTLNDLTKLQESLIQETFPKANINYLKTVKRNDHRILLRSIYIENYPTTEYTGFVEYENFILCTIHSRRTKKEKHKKTRIHTTERFTN